MKKVVLSMLLVLVVAEGAFAFDLSDPVSKDIKANKRYQFYSTFGSYTSVTINFKADLGRPAGLGYVRNIGSQDIELMPNYADDLGATMNPIKVGGNGVVWNFSPANLAYDTMKIRSTTATTLNIELIAH